MPRLFVAIPLPDDIRSELASVIEVLRPEIEDARWAPPENLHVTLAFLGRVEDDRVSGVGEAVARAASRSAAFSTTLAGLGAFPSTRRARVLWAGLDDDRGAAASVAAVVGAELAPLGFEPEARAFHAHITLARLRAPRPVRLEAPLASLGFDVGSIALVESHLGRPNARYETRASFPLGRSSRASGSSRT